DSSPLLRMPSGPHGGVETGVFGPREKEQFDLLAKWVQSATVVQDSPQPETVDIPPSGLIQASFSQPVQLPVLSANGEQPSGVARPAAPLDSANVAPQALQAPQAFVPRDPFDAEIFNRRQSSADPLDRPRDGR
ncbi:MAG: hypothetical protein JJ992_11305, partial [Planctomycetes bacterium]|nr:hypothetical protein [Planctomycetota bacterium]